MIIKTLYVHIPFCKHISGYCEPSNLIKNQDLEDKYINRLISQINKLPVSLENIYVGGATPTKLSTSNLKKLLDALNNLIISEAYEFTFEENPNNINKEKLELLKKYGVNRFALGYQLDDENIISNHKKYYDMHDAINMIRNIGIHNISVDLYFGFDGQSLVSFLNNLKSVIQSKPNHIALNELNDDSEMYRHAIKLLEKFGYEHYEVSNFALTNYKSKQNLTYYRYQDYYALGCGASEKIGSKRKTWTQDIDKYIQGDHFEEVLELDLEESMFEYIMMNLQLKQGFNINEFNDVFELDFFKYYHDILSDSKDLYIIENNIFKASDYGFLHLDELLIKFL